MERIGLVFRIKPHLKKEYKKVHDEIWPEMTEAIRASGIRNYSIFFKEGGCLFAYMETEDFNRSMDILSSSDVNEKWQKHVDKYFIKEELKGPGPEVEILEEVFHLD
jgi:L-rhamnose mutarotase